ncbi:zinc finger protein rotund-like [Calliphora vicina]|uniref:zinc finger protein rotund-like n=1 Tax=Calliphora vicina TaxID=7373 RepID=UPI00325ADA8B
MIMHGTWYKGPQLAHPHSHSEYHQFRSYPSFVVAPYHDASSSSSVVSAAAAAALTNSTAPSAPSAPTLVEGSFTATGVQSSNNLTVLSPTIKIEHSYSDHHHQHQQQSQHPAQSSLDGVEDYTLNGLDCSIVDSTTFKKPTNYVWPTANSEAEANNNTITDPAHLTNPATPPTPPPDTHLNLEHPSKSYNNSLKSLNEPELIEQQQQQQHQEISQSHKSLKHKQAAAASSSSSSEHHLGNGSNMPIGGVQGQNPTQGLVHWMSAVMAEHMTGQTHHDPTAVGMHYMWNGNMDVSMLSEESSRLHHSRRIGRVATNEDVMHNLLLSSSFIDRFRSKLQIKKLVYDNDVKKLNYARN